MLYQSPDENALKEWKRKIDNWKIYSGKHSKIGTFCWPRGALKTLKPIIYSTKREQMLSSYQVDWKITERAWTWKYVGGRRDTASNVQAPPRVDARWLWFPQFRGETNIKQCRANIHNEFPVMISNWYWIEIDNAHLNSQHWFVIQWLTDFDGRKLRQT